MVTFEVGELFSSFNDLTIKLSDYSEEHYSHFYIKDSKKLSPDEIVNDQLIYKHIVYSCIYGGQKPRFRGSGLRSVTSIRHGCPVSVYLRVTKDREHLQVRSFIETHNHEVNEELYRAAAQDKKLPEDLKREVEELLLLGADKDRLCDYIRYVSKKNLDKKNLFNIYEAAVKQQREISRDRALMLIQKVYAVETEEDAEQILQHLLSTEKPMRRSRKQEVEMVEDFEVAYVNESNSPQEVIEENVDDLTEDQKIERLMSTITGEHGEQQHIVIVQDGEAIQVIDAAETNVEEFLTEDVQDKGEGELEDGSQIIIKQEDDSSFKDFPKEIKQENPRFLTLKELSETFQNRKRKIVRTSPVKKKIMPSTFFQSGNSRTIYTEPLNKRRMYTSVLEDNEEVIDKEELNDVKIETIKAEHEKLLTETEVLKLKRNKIVKEINKLDVEKTKLYLEIDLLKEQKKSEHLKLMCLESELQIREHKNEKLRLEISKLKFELNEN